METLMNKINLALIAGLGLIASSPALAQDDPDTTIKGEVNINASLENSATGAIGDNAIATTDVGTISGSQINGTVDINATAENVVTGSLGDGAEARLEVGTINNAEIDGKVRINASAKNVGTIATGDKACAATRVGAIGTKSCPPK
jgi:hypothetical protein